MSRTAANEYIGAKRRPCTEAKPAGRRRILDEVCETTGHSRKYANRLLTGSRKFRERGGRSRLLRDVKREKPGSTRRNRRSGRNGELLKDVECKSGELVMGCDVPPGDVQTDTVAYCGGDMGGNF